MLKQLPLYLFLTALWPNPKDPLSAEEPVIRKAGEAAVPEAVSHLMLTGIATIGEKRFAYLVDATTASTIELSTGSPHPSGLELIEVIETAFGGNKARVRLNGSEWWLNFASPATLATSTSLIQIAAGTAPSAPAQNLGTFSNDKLSKRFETPSSRRKAMASYPLPPGL